jgi:hypothetical protein
VLATGSFLVWSRTLTRAAGGGEGSVGATSKSTRSVGSATCSTSISSSAGAVTCGAIAVASLPAAGRGCSTASPLARISASK